MKSAVVLLAFATFLTPATGVYADVTGYGVVKSVSSGRVVIRMESSELTCLVDAATTVTGAVVVVEADWVYVDVEASGHARTVTVQELAKRRAGVVKEVKGKGDVLLVKSGSQQESWNVTPYTILQGIDRGRLRAGDDIAVALYKNNNIATLNLIGRGAKF